MEDIIHHKHSLKILFKSKHFPGIYRRERECVFFIGTQCSRTVSSQHIMQKEQEMSCQVNSHKDGDRSKC